MKNTLLALMLVSSLFVISCGADATKPQDAYKNQTTETVTGTTTANFTAQTGIVDLPSSYNLSVGEKVTEIVQVTTVTGTTTNTNTVSAIKKNKDGGIYQFTINNTTASTTARVTYKYIIKEAAPMVEKETAGTYSSGGSLTIVINNNDFIFNKSIVSVTDKYGKQLTESDYNFDPTLDKVTINNLTSYIKGDIFTVRYTYRDITKITDKPLTGNVTVDKVTTTQATIQLDAAAYAGRSYYIKTILTGTDSTGIPLNKTVYDNQKLDSTGKITINAPTTAPTLTKITSGTYEIWFY